MLGETKCNALALKAEVVEPTPVGSHSYYSVGSEHKLKCKSMPLHENKQTHIPSIQERLLLN
jgi:hypothetical protein